MEFEDSCLGCGHLGVKQNDLEKFVQRYYALSGDEVAVALLVTSKHVFNLLANLVPCVGCRRRLAKYLTMYILLVFIVLKFLYVLKCDNLFIS